MSFGALFLGNYGQVIVDQDHPVYHVADYGSYSWNGSGQPIVTVNFSSPIKSSSKPLIFFKPNGAHMVYQFKINGSANNWTGFTFTFFADGGFSNIAYSGQWKAAAIYLEQASAWGLKVLDDGGRIVFDSNRPVVNIVSATQSWAKFSHNGNWQGTRTADTFRAPYTSGQWFMVSIWSGGSLGGMYGSDVGVGFLDGSSTTAQYVYCFAMQLGQGMSSIDSCNWPLILAT